MSVLMLLHRGRLLAVFSALVLFVVAGLLMPGNAAARIGPCRVDPELLLSDGTALQVQVDIDSQPSSVRQVVFTVHGPVGTSVTAIQKDAGLLGSAESVNYTPDQRPNLYVVEAIVTMVNGDADIGMFASVARGSVRSSQSAHGQSGEHLITMLRLKESDEGSPPAGHDD